MERQKEPEINEANKKDKQVKKMITEQ